MEPGANEAPCLNMQSRPVANGARKQRLQSALAVSGNAVTDLRMSQLIIQIYLLVSIQRFRFVDLLEWRLLMTDHGRVF